MINLTTLSNGTQAPAGDNRSLIRFPRPLRRFRLASFPSDARQPISEDAFSAHSEPKLLGDASNAWKVFIDEFCTTGGYCTRLGLTLDDLCGESLEFCRGKSTSGKLGTVEYSRR